MFTAETSHEFAFLFCEFDFLALLHVRAQYMIF
jgi:hypothetical protein